MVFGILQRLIYAVDCVVEIPQVSVDRLPVRPRYMQFLDQKFTVCAMISLVHIEPTGAASNFAERGDFGVVCVSTESGVVGDNARDELRLGVGIWTSFWKPRKSGRLKCTTTSTCFDRIGTALVIRCYP